MKLFVSYRRDDTSGRAGRLCDLLVAQFGASNVFQDVNAVAPGHDFRAQAQAAIETSDAVLIVIGPDWLRSYGADVGRRIDEEHDFVRFEVSVALSSGIPVVPVLVDGAVLPSRDELPDEMSEMLGRHAVTIRDTSWHLDVDDLIRRLKGEERLASPPRRWPIVVGVGLVIALVAFVVTTVFREPAGQPSASLLPACEQPDARWTQIELADDPTDEMIDDQGYTVGFEVLQAAFQSDNASARVVVLLKVTSESESEQNDTAYFYEGLEIEGLLVEGIQFDPDCFGGVTGSQALNPGQHAIAWTGFTTTGVQTGAQLLMALDNDGIVEIGSWP